MANGQLEQYSFSSNPLHVELLVEPLAMFPQNFGVQGLVSSFLSPCKSLGLVIVKATNY